MKIQQEQKQIQVRLDFIENLFLKSDKKKENYLQNGNGNSGFNYTNGPSNSNNYNGLIRQRNDILKDFAQYQNAME